ncbi:terminase small subunit [Anaerocolumna sp. MB42-C2]|nr:terminase small subunit [Anaerocolumna sp. MB42-C2]WMJ88878.1 terminase small subunit [Anaerocolumna sp. MB42-C2]
MKALTDKQKLFADEYLIDLNATRTYDKLKIIKHEDIKGMFRQ